MSEGGREPPSDPFADPDDEAALERERRRQERERRRQEREQRRRARAEGGTPPHRPAADRPPRARRVPFAGAFTAIRRRAADAVPRGRPGGGLRRALARPFLVLGFLGGIVLIWFLVSLFQPFHGEGSGRVVVTIPDGATAGEIGDLLEEKKVISNSTFFGLRVRLAGKREDLLSGTYTLARDMSYGDVIGTLSSPPGKEGTITFAVPEGYSRREVAPLARDAGIPGDYLKATVRSPALDPESFGAQGRARTLEGFLFPATYVLPPRSGADALVAQQLRAFRSRLRKVDLSYARSKNLTVYDVLIIASMVEREVLVPRERPLVAAVIYNRLRAGMPLGIDATVRFAVNNFTEPLTISELDTDSPYNTRKFAGLPPGPIGNPGFASIKAAANPARVPYLFFVVKPGTCGEHDFSSTEAEFLRDEARYNEAREAAGGSPTEC